MNCTLNYFYQLERELGLTHLATFTHLDHLSQYELGIFNGKEVVYFAAAFGLASLFDAKVGPAIRALERANGREKWRVGGIAILSAVPIVAASYFMGMSATATAVYALAASCTGLVLSDPQVATREVQGKAEPFDLSAALEVSSDGESGKGADSSTDLTLSMLAGDPTPQRSPVSSHEQLIGSLFEPSRERKKTPSRKPKRSRRRKTRTKCSQCQRNQIIYQQAAQTAKKCVQALSYNWTDETHQRVSVRFRADDTVKAANRALNAARETFQVRGSPKLDPRTIKLAASVKKVQSCVSRLQRENSPDIRNIGEELRLAAEELPDDLADLDYGRKGSDLAHRAAAAIKTFVNKQKGGGKEDTINAIQAVFAEMEGLPESDEKKDCLHVMNEAIALVEGGLQPSNIELRTFRLNLGSLAGKFRKRYPS